MTYEIKQRYFLLDGNELMGRYKLYDAVTDEIILVSSWTEINCLCHVLNEEHILYIRAVMEYCY